MATFSAPPAAAVNSAIEFDASESSAGGAKITSYKWDFGDETTGNDKKIKHIYKTPGKYFVALNIETDSETSCNTTSTRSLIIINDTPVAEAGPDQLVGVIQIVIFDGSGSSDSDGSIASYQWDFGDGSTGKGVQTRHNYNEPGEYDVTLRVTDDTNLENNWATDKLTVTVNAAPVPVIEMPDWVCVGQEVEFDGGKSHDPDGKRASFHWDFGDGAAVNGSKVTHVYITPGQYNVILSVNDGREVSNSRAETSKMIRVNHPPMVDAGPDRLICPNQEITFDASGSFDHDGTITRYLWNFGDGDRAEGKIVKHSYADPGLFRAELTISDNSGTDCGVVTDLVEVRVNAPPVANAGADREAFVGGAHDAVAFDGTQSSDPDGNPLTYFWDFGDGATAEGPIVSHAYKAPGTYIVKMRVRDDTGLPCGEAWAKATIKVRYRDAALR